LLAKSNYNILTNHGVLLKSPVIDIKNEFENPLPFLYYSPQNNYSSIKNQDGTTTFIVEADDNGVLENKNIIYKIEKDHWGNYKYFSTESTTNIVHLTEKYIYYPLKNGHDDATVIYNWITY